MPAIAALRAGSTRTNGQSHGTFKMVFNALLERPAQRALQ